MRPFGGRGTRWSSRRLSSASSPRTLAWWRRLGAVFGLGVSAAISHHTHGRPGRPAARHADEIPDNEGAKNERLMVTAATRFRSTAEARDVNRFIDFTHSVQKKSDDSIHSIAALRDDRAHWDAVSFQEVRVRREDGEGGRGGEGYQRPADSLVRRGIGRGGHVLVFYMYTGIEIDKDIDMNIHAYTHQTKHRHRQTHIHMHVSLSPSAFVCACVACFR